MTIRIARLFVSLLYGALTLAASVIAIINNTDPIWSYIMMAAASILLIAINNKKYSNKAYLVAIPLLLIHISALVNGSYMGGINISHHIVRLIVSVLIFMLFFLSKDKDKAINK